MGVQHSFEKMNRNSLVFHGSLCNCRSRQTMQFLNGNFSMFCHTYPHELHIHTHTQARIYTHKLTHTYTHNRFVYPYVT